MKITEIPFVGHPTNDVERAREFYEKVLGLEASFAEIIDPANGIWWIEYNIGEAHCLAVSNAWPPRPEGSQGGPTVTFEVEDLEASIEELKTKGDFMDSKVMESPVCRFALAKDPDGNPFMLHQRKA